MVRFGEHIQLMWMPYLPEIVAGFYLFQVLVYMEYAFPARTWTGF